jgi:glycosyltransferase involved in cell wall biosynthesis
MQKAMKVLHLMAGAPTGGAETYCVDALLALQSAGFEQMLITRKHTQRLDDLRAAGVKIVIAPFGKIFRGATRRALADAIKEFQPDIIQYWMGRAASYAAVGAHRNIGWFGGYYDLKRYPHMDAYVGVTYDIARHIRNAGAPENKVFTIHTIADLPIAAPIARAEFETPEHAPLLLALARLHPKKGLDVLLRALVNLPEAYCWIAGDGPLKDELPKLARELGVADRVRFLGWRNDRAALLATCDVCVFPSRYEPFGTVTIEAWAAGKPLIVTAAAGPKAYVKNEENGLLVPIDDVAALQGAIRRVINDFALREKIVAGGRASYEAQFTPAVMVAAYQDLYARVLA